MIVLLGVLVLVVLAFVGAGLLGIGVLSGGSGQGRKGLLAVLSAPVVVVVGVALVVVLGLGVLGGAGPPGSGSSPAGPAPPAPTTTAPVGPLPRATVQTVPGSLPVVWIRAATDDRFALYEPVGGLTPGAVVRVRAEGFAELERGRVEQCVVELARQTACGPSAPVQFDVDGRADFQFAVRAEISPGGCRVGQATCVVRVTGEDSDRQGATQTVFGDDRPPGLVTVSPARGVADGQAVVVSVRGFPPGTSATAVLCAPPAAYDAQRCTPPTASSTFTVDGEGTGRTTLVVTAGRLCGPGRPCGVAVVVGPGFVAAPSAPITFSTGPGVAYDRGRVIPGVAIAFVLVVVGIGIVRRTDWAKPTEADAPELDGADLRSDQDLDQLFGTDEELDAPGSDPVVTPGVTRRAW